MIEKSCKWQRAVDGHFNISCVNETGLRGNGAFRGTWNFIYCPYCGGRIREPNIEKSTGCTLVPISPLV